MRKTAKYSPSRRPTQPVDAVPGAVVAEPAAQPRPARRWRTALAQGAANPRVMWAAIALLSVALIAAVWQRQAGSGAPLTQ